MPIDFRIERYFIEQCVAQKLIGVQYPSWLAEPIGMLVSFGAARSKTR
jgi:hypothetical protein